MKACPQCNLKYPSDKTACFVDGSELIAIQDQRIGTSVAGRYEIETVLGEGGMATVYRAHHRLIDRPCAVKIISETHAKNQVLRERFRREAKAAQKLAHPNIIEIFDQGETADGSVYLVMELLDGETLADVLDRGKVPMERALPILIQVGRALARAHDLEVIHRDLKPENVFVSYEAGDTERVVLLDFGIARSMQDARLTGAGEVFGTPQYMAPERITSIDAGPSADIYAMGVLMFEMLTGRLPFDAEDVTGFFVKHLKEPPPPLSSVDPSLPTILNELCQRMMAKTPEERPVDAHRVVADLTGICAVLGIRVPEEPSPEVESGRSPAATLPPVALDRWVRRTAVFEQMLEKAYPNGRPQGLSKLLGKVKMRVKEVTDLRQQSVGQQRNLEAIETRGREGRQRFGHAVHALGVDASKARDHAKDAQAALAECEARMLEYGDRARGLHSKVLQWEGRSAFQMPYKELADAYRELAELVDEWCGVQQEKARAEQEVATRRAEVEDLEFQIQALRNALANHEEEIERQTEQTQAEVSRMGDEADRLEADLLELATEFCAPLRRLPQLGHLFRELEADAAA